MIEKEKISTKIRSKKVPNFDDIASFAVSLKFWNVRRRPQNAPLSPQTANSQYATRRTINHPQLAP